MKAFFIMIAITCAALLFGCASHRQGVVCSEIEYRLNTMSYSPDQRYYMEEELRSCREEEELKKNAEGQTRKSIYERYASNSVHTEADTTASTENKEASVSELMGDTSHTETVSIYDRYGTVAPVDSSEQTAEETSEGTADETAENAEAAVNAASEAVEEAQ